MAFQELYIAQPDIPFNAITTSASSENTDYPHENTYFGGSNIYWKTASAVTNSYVTYDLGSGGDKSIDYLAIRGLKLMTANDNGNIDIKVAGSTDNFAGSNVTVLSKTGIFSTDLQGPNGEDYLLTLYDNKILSPSDFTTTWATTRASITANSIIGPDGLDYADKLVEDGTAADTHSVNYPTVSVTSGQQYQYSVYAKAAGRYWVRFQPGEDFTNADAYFNLNTGTVGTINSGADSATILDVGDGWFLLTIVATATATSANTPYIFLAEADNDATYSGDSSSGIYIHKAQFTAVTTAVSTAYRYWRISLDSTASFVHLARKLYCGTLFSFGGRSPIYPYKSEYNSSSTGFASDSGALFQSSKTIPRREYSFTWNGVTDTYRNVFDSKYNRFKTEMPFILHQPDTAIHSPLNNNKVVFAWNTGVSHQTGQWRSSNTVECSFVEDVA